MPNKIRYLFDSDVLISSARLHYAPAFCMVFWDWLLAGHLAGLFFSIDKVKAELLDGDKDPLHEWANSNQMVNFFQTSLPSIGQWGELAKQAMDIKRGYKEIAKNRFLDAEKADAWLISHAAHHTHFVIVTNETSRPESVNDIKLPDAAHWLGVQTIKPHELLQAHAGHNFTFRN